MTGRSAHEKSLRRLRLTIAYDGRPFCGWQSQAKGGSVQDHLEAALARLCGGRIALHGSGRTDAGVHALAQVAHADVPGGRLASLRRWMHALNASLPPEIRVVRAQWAPPGFEARFSATGKIYRYRIWNGEVFPPSEIGRAWHVPLRINPDALRACAEALVGTHDFAGYAANRGTPVTDTVRTVRRIDIAGRRRGLITLTFEGDGFLYKMVRLMTGTLVRAAQGKEGASTGEAVRWVQSFLPGENGSSPGRKTSFAAPAEGLFLVRVLYAIPERDT